MGYADENVLLPQWAIAVIVIGLASLLFVIIFGVTVVSIQTKFKETTIRNSVTSTRCLKQLMVPLTARPPSGE